MIMLAAQPTPIPVVLVASTPAPARTWGAPPSASTSCYHYGQPGHYVGSCLKKTCTNCGKQGHDYRRCPEPASGANNTPVIQRAMDSP